MGRRLGSKQTALALAAVLLLGYACGSDDGASTDAEGDDGASTEAEPEAAGDWEPVWEDGVLQPLPDGFPEQPITIINVDDPGTRDGIYARDLKNILDNTSPVEILISDEPAPAFGTFYTLDDLQNRDGADEGYFVVITTVPGTVSDLHAEPITEELGLDIDDFQPFIITETIPYVLVQRTDAPWGDTFEEMVAYAQENPGELRYLSNGVGSGNDIAMEWIMQELDFEVNKIPAAGNQEAVSAIGAGEGDFSLTQADVALTNWQADRVEVTLTTGSAVPPPWDEDDNVVDSESAGLPPAPFGIVLSLTTLAEVPEDHVDWLFELFSNAAETDEHQEREERIPGLEVSVVSQEDVDRQKMELYDFTEEVIRNIGLHHEDN